jgi:sphinganine-1-phosphate aldolase
MASLQQHRRPVEDVISDLTDKRVNDVKWADGRAFGMIYDGGPSVHEVAEQAARLFLHENALNTKAFPSLGQIQSEVVGWTADLLHGDDAVAGFLTSGGTESSAPSSPPASGVRPSGRSPRRRWSSPSRRTPRSTRRRTTSA